MKKVLAVSSIRIDKRALNNPHTIIEFSEKDAYELIGKLTDAEEQSLIRQTGGEFVARFRQGMKRPNEIADGKARVRLARYCGTGEFFAVRKSQTTFIGAQKEIFESLKDLKCVVVPHHVGVAINSKGRLTEYAFMRLYEWGDGVDFYNRVAIAPDEKLVITFFRKFLHACIQIHGRGIFHVDIKPENFLFKSNGEFAICDFEFATRDLLSGRLRGSPGYIAPEVVEVNQTRKAYSPAQADVWSAGVVGLTHIMPDYQNEKCHEKVNFNHPSPYVAWLKNISPTLEQRNEIWAELASVMLHPNPAERRSLEWALKEVNDMPRNSFYSDAEFKVKFRALPALPPGQ